MPYKFEELGDARETGLALFGKGYTVCKIILPTRGEVTWDRIEAALKIRAHSMLQTKAAKHNSSEVLKAARSVFGVALYQDANDQKR